MPFAIGILIATSHAQTNRRGENFPAVNLPRKAQGAAIPLALGANLPRVAAWYERSEAELRALCNRDRSLQADRQGRLHYVCAGLGVQAGGAVNASTASGTTIAQGPFPAADTFFLHSKAGASKVIYLDFNGHVTSGTSWNSSFTGGANIVTPAYSTDADPSTFSTTELDNIQSIWQRVAEDYAPFDVDVTTQDPGLEALRKTTTSDTAFGVRVCIGGSSYDWYGAGAGGVAYLGSFSWNSDTPCFVFTAQLGNGNAKYTAEATSHEAGHTFNLSHDGQTTGVEYYEGHANWAPIMGVGYYKDVVQWSRGEYASANNTQDDTLLISNITGYRIDAHGDSIVNATPLSGTSLSASGIIERRTDADLFGFSTGAGPISFSAVPAAPSPNLDILLGLYDGVGNLVTSSSPTTLGATLSTTVSQGTYYLAVEGTGTGDPVTAYNDYGSLGQFSLTGSLIPLNGQAPVAVADASAPLTGLTPLAVNFSSVGSSDADGTIVSYSWDFGNGATSTLPNPAYTYTAPGTYVASLVVKDDSGLSSAADTVTVVVQNNTVVYVSNITMSLTNSKQGYQATATVTVRDQTGATKSGATVTGTWSGAVSGTVSKSTDRQGNASLTSPRTRNTGRFTFTVTGITLSGFTYAPTRNTETSDSISTP
ncbi:MAG: PKD repeat-containing protein [Verrucomicrobia bacterium]|nr:MAG: PKD repeat-containing protein [Verrucomicrobiota bacterium]